MARVLTPRIDAVVEQDDDPFLESGATSASSQIAQKQRVCPSSRWIPLAPCAAKISASRDPSPQFGKQSRPDVCTIVQPNVGTCNVALRASS